MAGGAHTRAGSIACMHRADYVVLYHAVRWRALLGVSLGRFPDGKNPAGVGTRFALTTRRDTAHIYEVV